MKHFVADTHFAKTGHCGMLNMRPFKTALEMSEHFIDQINKYVKRQDVLYIVGDYAQEVEGRWRQAINCRDVWVILGNHDRPAHCIAALGRSKVRERYMAKVGGVPTWLEHYANAFWPMSHRASNHCYGHTHRQREATLERAFPGRKAIDCGMDNALYIFGEYRPFPEDWLVEYFNSRPGHDLLEFYYEFQLANPVKGCDDFTQRVR